MKITLMPETDRGIFLDKTKAEWRNRLCLQEGKLITVIMCISMSHFIVKLANMLNTHGITIAPSNEMASLVAPLPLSCGTKSP